MVHIVAVHSSHEGAGKSTIVANVALLLAEQGKRVGIIDANLKAWTLPRLFQVPDETIGYTFNDYLLERCQAPQAACNITTMLQQRYELAGSLFLISTSTDPRAFARVVREGYSIRLITEGLREFAEQLELDILLIDTHAGLNEDTLLSVLSIGICDTAIIVLRLDQREYQGTGVAIDIANILEVPRVVLIPNQVATTLAPVDVKRQMEQVYQRNVAAVLHFSDEIASLEMADLVTIRHPDHPVNERLRQVSTLLLEVPAEA